MLAAAESRPEARACHILAPARTRYANLWLAGDWIDTGLPATIESAVRSGHDAARLVLDGG